MRGFHTLLRRVTTDDSARMNKATRFPSGSEGERISVMLVGPSSHFLGGITYYTYSLANHLADLTTVSVAFYRKLLPRFAFPGRRRVGQNLSSLALRSDIGVFDGFDYKSPISWKHGRDFLSRVDPDVVLVMWWTMATGHITRLLQEWSRACDSVTVADIHEIGDPMEQRTPLLGGVSRRVARHLIRRFEHVIVHAPQMKARLVRDFGLSTHSCTYLPFPVASENARIDRYKEARERWCLSGKKVVLLPGLIRRHKGQSVFLKAIEKMSVSSIDDVSFIIAGEVWEGASEFDSLAQQLIRSSSLRVINRYLSDEEFESLLTACDLVVLPYLESVQSAIAASAMSLGKPLLVSGLPGLRDQLADYEGATFFEPGNSTELASAIREFLCGIVVDSPVTLRPPARLAWPTIADQYLDLFARLA